MDYIEESFERTPMLAVSDFPVVLLNVPRLSRKIAISRQAGKLHNFRVGID